MVKVEMKGIAKSTAKGRDYYYAWRKGPRLRGEPGSPEFMASYHEAHENRRTPDTGRARSLVTLYKGQRRSDLMAFGGSNEMELNVKSFDRE